MNRSVKKTLKVQRETLRVLNQREMTSVEGGGDSFRTIVIGRTTTTAILTGPGTIGPLPTDSIGHPQQCTGKVTDLCDIIRGGGVFDP